MIFGLFLLAIIYFFYLLFIQGYLWKIILTVTGWFGMVIGLRMYFPESIKECIKFQNYSFSWAIVISSTIVLLAMMYTKES